MMIWIVNSLLISAWCFILLRQPAPASLKPFLVPGLAFKLVAGILVGLLYQLYYKEEGDTFFLFNLASYLAELLPRRATDFFNIVLFNKFDSESKTFFFIWNQPRALFFVKILAIVNIVTQSNYWLSSLYLSLFSFSGLWYLASWLVREREIPAYLAALAFLFFPSFVFWSSGVLKESVMTGCMGFLIVSSLHLLQPGAKHKSRHGIITLIAFIILLQLKYYYAGIIGAMLIAYSLTKITLRQNSFRIPAPSCILFGLFLTIGFLLATFLHPNTRLSAFPQALYTNYQATLAQNTHPDYTFSEFAPTWTSIIQNAPRALYQGLFGPDLQTARATIQIPAALENLFLGLLLFVIISYRSYTRQWAFSTESVAVLTYVLISAVLMAYASPNFGSLIRYKTGFIPFLILLAGYRNPLIDYFLSGSEIRRQKGQPGS